MISYLCISLATWLLAFKFLSIIQNSPIYTIINHLHNFLFHSPGTNWWFYIIHIYYVVKSEWNKNRSRLAELFIRVNSLNILNDRHSHSIYRLGYYLREMFYMQITHKEQNNVFFNNICWTAHQQTCFVGLKMWKK